MRVFAAAQSPAPLAVALLALLASPQAARAHGAGLSYLDLRVEGGVVRGAFDVPAQDLARKLLIDADRDGLLSVSDVEASQAALTRWLAASVRVVAAGQVCQPRTAASELREDALLTVRADWDCGPEIFTLDVASRLLDTLGDGHSTYVRAAKGTITAEQLFTRQDTAATFSLSSQTALGAAGRFFVLGMEHIFGGIDHVLFLLSLLLLGGSLRRVLAIATSFTVAHSITLTLAALGWVTIPSRLVESAIALTIAWVAVEDWLHAKPPVTGAAEPLGLRLRWVLTFVFGLVHGFGFASVLAGLGLPADHLPVALASFNLGVEAGQLVILLVAMPLISGLSRREWYRPRGVQFASLGLFGVAVYWFVQRAFG